MSSIVEPETILIDLSSDPTTQHVLFAEELHLQWDEGELMHQARESFDATRCAQPYLEVNLSGNVVPDSACEEIDAKLTIMKKAFVAAAAAATGSSDEVLQQQQQLQPPALSLLDVSYCGITPSALRTLLAAVAGYNTGLLLPDQTFTILLDFTQVAGETLREIGADIETACHDGGAMKVSFSLHGNQLSAADVAGLLDACRCIVEVDASYNGIRAPQMLSPEFKRPFLMHPTLMLLSLNWSPDDEAAASSATSATAFITAADLDALNLVASNNIFIPTGKRSAAPSVVAGRVRDAPSPSERGGRSVSPSLHSSSVPRHFSPSRVLLGGSPRACTPRRVHNVHARALPEAPPSPTTWKLFAAEMTSLREELSRVKCNLAENILNQMAVGAPIRRKAKKAKKVLTTAVVKSKSKKTNNDNTQTSAAAASAVQAHRTALGSRGTNTPSAVPSSAKSLATSSVGPTPRPYTIQKTPLM